MGRPQRLARFDHHATELAPLSETAGWLRWIGLVVTPPNSPGRFRYHRPRRASCRPTPSVVFADCNSRATGRSVPRRAAGLERVQEHAFVFERAPQPFDEDVVHPASAPVHRDPDLGIP